MAHKLRGKEIIRLMLGQGMTKARLARKARVSTKSLNRWLAGEPASVEGLLRLSLALDVKPEELRDDYVEPPPSSDVYFDLGIRIQGRLNTPEQAARMALIAPKMIEYLLSLGIDVGFGGFEMKTVYKPKAEELEIVIVLLVEGFDKRGVETWIYLAIKVGDLEKMRDFMVQGKQAEAIGVGVVEAAGYGKPTREAWEAMQQKYPGRAALPKPE